MTKIWKTTSVGFEEGMATGTGLLVSLMMLSMKTARCYRQVGECGMIVLVVILTARPQVTFARPVLWVRILP